MKPRTCILVQHLLIAIGFSFLMWSPIEGQVSWSPGVVRCVSSLDPSEANYYEDRSECPIGENKHWLLGVQSEATLGNSCVGPNAHSLPINVGGPISLTFEPFVNKHAVRLRTDFYNFSHPCTGETWTWFSLMDHVWAGGGPLPDVGQLKAHIRGIYNETTGTNPTRIGNISGISRMGVTWQGWWSNRSFLVDVNLYTHPSWGDVSPDFDVIYFTETPTFTYIVLRGDQWRLNEDTSTLISFDEVVFDLISRNLLPAPAVGEPMLTVSVGPFTETHTLTPSGFSVAVDFLIKDFRVF